VVQEPLVGNPSVSLPGQGESTQYPEESDKHVENVHANEKRGATQDKNAKKHKKDNPNDKSGKRPVAAVTEYTQEKDKKNGGREGAPP
jgi:hypothetical protein